jgi:PilZ domain
VFPASDCMELSNLYDQYRGLATVGSGTSWNVGPFVGIAIGVTKMRADQVHLERRAAQRFDFQLPVIVRLADTEREGHGFTRDLSGRGAFFYTAFRVSEGDAVELTLVMPSEITLTESMRVRCRGKVTRVLPAEDKFGVAVHLEGYEFLPEAESAAEISANFPRISAAQSPHQAGKNPQILDLPDIVVDSSGTTP